MTVWQLALALLGHAIGGRGGCRVNVVFDGLPDAVQAEVDEHPFVCAQAWAPYTRCDRFVVIAAEPESIVDSQKP